MKSSKASWAARETVTEKCNRQGVHRNLLFLTGARSLFLWRMDGVVECVIIVYMIQDRLDVIWVRRQIITMWRGVPVRNRRERERGTKAIPLDNSLRFWQDTLRIPLVQPSPTDVSHSIWRLFFCCCELHTTSKINFYYQLIFLLGSINKRFTLTNVAFVEGIIMWISSFPLNSFNKRPWPALIAILLFAKQLTHSEATFGGNLSVTATTSAEDAFEQKLRRHQKEFAVERTFLFLNDIMNSTDLTFVINCIQTNYSR